MLTEGEQNVLIQANMGLPKAIAAMFRGGEINLNKRLREYILASRQKAEPIPLEELISEGVLGLVKAARSFNATESQFPTWATECIVSSICNFARAWQQFTPLKLTEDGEKERDFWEWDIFLNGFPYESWTTLAASPEELMLAFEDLCSSAAQLASVKQAIKFLSRREREIIAARFFGNPPQTIESIAREHRISYSTTVEIIDNILKKLKKREESKIIQFPARAGQRTKTSATAQSIARSARPSR